MKRLLPILNAENKKYKRTKNTTQDTSIRCSKTVLTKQLLYVVTTACSNYSM